MQVAKYWRNNQLRYRLHGVIQQKVVIDDEAIPVKVSDNKQQQEGSPAKVKIA